MFGLFNDGIQQNHGLNRKEKMLLAADCLSAAGVNVFGADFPKVELDFMPGPTKGYYGGLRPDNKIQINSANLSQDKVIGSEFSGDASFIELVAHESTHLIQRHLSETSDGETPDARLSMRVAEAFYESTAGAKEFNRDLYWQHPFETQAREYAHELVVALGDSANASFEASDRPPLRSTGIRPAFAKG